MRQKRFNAGEIIYEKGEVSENALLLLSGQVEIFVESDTGRTVLGYVSAGEFLGEMGLLNTMPRSASARAKTTVEGHELSYRELTEALSERPGMALRVINRLSERLRLSNERIVEGPESTGGSGEEYQALEKTCHGARIFGDHEQLTAILPAEGIALTESEYSVGRAGIGTTEFLHRITLPDLESHQLSVNHFLISSTAGAVFIRDNASELGTRVNGTYLGKEFALDTAQLTEQTNIVIAGGVDSIFCFRIVLG